MGKELKEQETSNLEFGGMAPPSRVGKKSWLSELPANWEIVLVKHLFRFNVSSGAPRHDRILSLTRRGIVERDISGNEGQLAESYDKYPEIEVGDFALNPMDLAAGWVARTDIPGKISGAYYSFHVVDENRANPDFYEYLFQSYYREKIFDPFGSGLGRMESGGGRWTLGRDVFMNFPVPLPPVEEQQNLVAYLNQETSKIDLLISKKEQLIEKLLERRQALITQVVTKGLDLDVPMKDSGIEWIGEVPADWNIDRIRHAFRSTKGGVWGNEPNGDTNDFWCVRVADFDRVRLSITDKKKTFRNVKPGERNGRVISDGDILIEKSGGGEKSPVGFAVSISFKETAIFSNFINVLRIKSDQASSFWVYSLAALYYSGATWRSIKQTSGIQNLDIKSYLKEPVVFPPQPDQILVVRNLKSKTESIDKLITVTTSSIALLKERRQALITQVVTGKLDVRGLSDGDS